MKPYKILLYYFFSRVNDPETWVKNHQDFCLARGIKGRVYIAHEGINGTVSGSIQAMTEYKNFIESSPEFAGIEWKEDDADVIPFEKMKTKLKKFIVNMGLENEVDVKKYSGKHLEPKEWRRVLESTEDYVLLDVRNKYEGDIGKFAGAIVTELDSFSEFPKLAKELGSYKDKKILMYCTGGIRCEKFSALLVRDGFKDVNQLHGGIIRYMHEENGEHFEGSCFVFDDRMVLKVNPEKNETPISHCKYCQKPEDRPINCANMTCNELFVICDECARQHVACCSPDCEISPKRRPFHLETFRIPYRKKGLVFPHLGLTPKKDKTTLSNFLASKHLGASGNNE